jgi:Fe-S-cluster-containing hydrogenase component 2
MSSYCLGSGSCSTLCPINNIIMHDKKPIASHRCTMFNAASISVQKSNYTDWYASA